MATNNNDAIIQRIKGIPMQKGTLKDKFDPRNPNRPEANDNAPAVTNGDSRADQV